MSVQFSEEVNHYDLGPSPTRMMEKSDDEQTDGTITDDDSVPDNADGDNSDYPSVKVIDHRDNNDRMMKTKTKTKSSPRGTWLFGFGGGGGGSGGGGGGGEGLEEEQEEEKPKLQHDETDLEVPTSSNNTKNNSTDAKDVQEYLYKNSTYGDYIVDNVICIPGDFIEGCLCSTDQILGICQTTEFIETSSGIELCATTHCNKFNSDDDDDIDVIVSSSSPNMQDKDCVMDILVVDEVDDPIDEAESTLVEMKATASWLNRTKKPVLPSELKKKKKNPKVHHVIPTEEEEQGQEEKYPRYVPLYVVETITVGTAIAAAVSTQDKEEELPSPLRKDILETKSTVAAATATVTATATTTTTATAKAKATTDQEQKQEQEQATVLKDDAVVVVVVEEAEEEEEEIPTIATTTAIAAARSNNKSVVVVEEEEEEDPSNISDNNNNNDNNTSNNDNRNRNRNNSVVSIIPIQRSIRLENKDSSKVIADNDTAATDATKKKNKKKKNKISLTKKLNKWKKHFTSSL